MIHGSSGYSIGGLLRVARCCLGEGGFRAADDEAGRSGDVGVSSGRDGAAVDLVIKP